MPLSGQPEERGSLQSTPVAPRRPPPETDSASRDSPAAEPTHQPAPPSAWGLRLKLRDRWVFYLLLTLMHALSCLPDLVLYPLGWLGGWLGYLIDHRHVRIGLRNLAVAFPERTVADRRKLLRASYVNLGRAGAEYLRLGGFFYRRLKHRVTYQGFERWEEIRRRYPGRGLLVLTAHFGNFELLCAGHAMHGYQISLVHHNQRWLAGEALMSWVRERAGVEIIRKHSAARAVLKSLRQGKIVGIPFDQNAKRSEAVFVPFFGELAATSSGPARLALISGAPVLPVFIVRQPDRRSHRIVIEEEIQVRRSGDLQADIEENTRRFVAAIEDVVRRYPQQFLWTHRRYRTRPRGMSPIYD